MIENFIEKMKEKYPTWTNEEVLKYALELVEEVNEYERVI